MRLLLRQGVNVNAQGVFGTAFQAALVPIDHHLYCNPLKRNSPYIAEILLGHGADITANVPNSKYGDALRAAKELWKDGGANLARFMKLLELRESKGCQSGTHENGLQV